MRRNCNFCKCFCLFPIWSFTSSGIDVNELFSSPFEEAHEKLCESMYHALHYCETGIAPHLRTGLLEGSEQEGDENQIMKIEADSFSKKRSEEKEILESKDTPKFVGVPTRPLYREMTRRILLLTRWYYKYEYTKKTLNSERNDILVQIGHRPFINAEDLGLTEKKPTPALYYFPSPSQKRIFPTSASKWLQSIGSDGILEILGMRLTRGTRLSSLPPTISELHWASRKPHRPHTKAPSLSVAARARSKHAHRGEKDQFFGVVEGSVEAKNVAADKILLKMIENAAWINIHTFGGIASYVFEIREANGYGARWGIDWDKDTCNVNNVEFRGFLEPQMERGFEKKWRH